MRTFLLVTLCCLSTGVICSAQCDTIQVEFYSNPWICGSQESQLILTEAYSSYVWSTNETTATVWISSPGTYCVTVSDSEGCTGSACVDIDQINVEPAIIGDTTMCQDGSTYLQVNNFWSQYSWSIGTTTSAIVVDVGGIYCVTVTDEHDCIGSTCIEIQELPAPDFDVIVDLGFCEGGSATLLAFSSEELEYMWSTGISDTSEITVTWPGFYCVTATNAHGCSSEQCVFVDESPFPIIDIQVPEYLCSNETLLLTCPEVTFPGVTCLINGVPFEDTISLGPGTYEIILQMPGGCMTTSGQFTLTAGISTHIPLDTTLCHGELLLLGGQIIRESVTDSLIWLGENSFGCDSSYILTATFIEIEVEDTVTGNAIKGNAAISLENVNGGTAPYMFRWSNGATTRTISGLYSGHYTVTITESTGCERIISYRLPQGIVGSTGENHEVVIHPNPIQSEVVINTAFQDGSPWSLEVIDVLGTHVLSRHFRDSKVQLEFHYPPGLYYFIVTDYFGNTDVSRVISSGRSD